MARPRILLIGCGQIGTRLLQSIVTATKNTCISCVDPRASRLELAETRVSEILSGQQTTNIISYHSGLAGSYEAIDLAVIATTSGPRYEIFKDLMSRATPQVILFEKFLFQNIREYAEVEKVLMQNRTKAFVHAPRTAWPGYKQLAVLLADDKEPLRMTVIGANWAMASNAVHFISIFEKLAGRKIALWDPKGLNTQPTNNKRTGYLEVSGTLRATTASDDILTLFCATNEQMDLTVKIEKGEDVYIVDENRRQFSHLPPGGSGQQQPFDILFASQMQASIKALLESEKSDLPTYEEMMAPHLALIPIFNRVFFGENGDDRPCPVT